MITRIAKIKVLVGHDDSLLQSYNDAYYALKRRNRLLDTTPTEILKLLDQTYEANKDDLLRRRI